MRSRRCWLLLLSLLGGCSALVNPDEGRLGGAGEGSGDASHDASGDAGTTPSGRDSGPSPGVDGSVSLPDASTTPPGADAGSADGCVEGASRCEADVLVTCSGGVEQRADCQSREAYCEGGACQRWVCEPGASACTESLTHSSVCNERGSGAALVECELSCDTATGTCSDEPPEPCGALPEIGIGDVQTFDLCDGADEATYEPTSDGCPAMERADSPDRTFVLRLSRATEVLLELTDADPGAVIDTVVYIRRTCDEQSSQLACDDDVPCWASTVPPPGGCSGDLELRQSRIRTRLSAGTYYVVADAFVYSEGGVDHTCGQVRLALAAAR